MKKNSLIILSTLFAFGLGADLQAGKKKKNPDAYVMPETIIRKNEQPEATLDLSIEQPTSQDSTVELNIDLDTPETEKSHARVDYAKLICKELMPKYTKIRRRLTSSYEEAVENSSEETTQIKKDNTKIQKELDLFEEEMIRAINAKTGTQRDIESFETAARIYDENDSFKGLFYSSNKFGQFNIRYPNLTALAYDSLKAETGNEMLEKAIANTKKLVPLAKLQFIASLRPQAKGMTEYVGVVEDLTRYLHEAYSASSHYTARKKEAKVKALDGLYTQIDQQMDNHIKQLSSGYNTQLNMEGFSFELTTMKYLFSNDSYQKKFGEVECANEKLEADLDKDALEDLGLEEENITVKAECDVVTSKALIELKSTGPWVNSSKKENVEENKKRLDQYKRQIHLANKNNKVMWLLINHYRTNDQAELDNQLDTTSKKADIRSAYLVPSDLKKLVNPSKDLTFGQRKAIENFERRIGNAPSGLYRNIFELLKVLDIKPVPKHITNGFNALQEFPEEECIKSGKEEVEEVEVEDIKQAATKPKKVYNGNRSHWEKQNSEKQKPSRGRGRGTASTPTLSDFITIQQAKPRKR